MSFKPHPPRSAPKPRMLTPEDIESLVARVSQPTVSFCRRAVLWSGERRQFDRQFKADHTEFRERSYNYYQYPTLKKHYPGTWRSGTREEITSIVDRLCRPTRSSRARRDFLLPPAGNTHLVSVRA